MPKETIALKKIRIDGGTQARVKIDDAAVAEYAELPASDLPPIDLVFDGAEYWLADGFHRYHAHSRRGEKLVEAQVRKGTLWDAIQLAAGANGHHGLRRTNADKRKAVKMIMGRDEAKGFSDRKVAEICAVEHHLVADVRKQLGESPSSNGNVGGGHEPKKRVGIDGKSRPGKDKPAGGQADAQTEREPGDDTDAIKAESAKRRASGKEKVSPKDRKAALAALGVVVRFIDKIDQHEAARPHLEAITALVKGS